MNRLSLREYWHLLDTHDWHYQYSDDHGVWKAGHERQVELQKAAAESEPHGKMYRAFRAHIFSGPAFGNKQKPKPKMPRNDRSSVVSRLFGK